VSETIGHPPDVEPGPLRRSPRPSWVRLAVEFALLFAIAVVLKQFVVTGTNYPNPLWLPVVVLSLEHGLAAGLTATIIAAGVQYSGGLPPAYLTEDMYAYVSRVATEPVSWACVALLIGHFRSRQIVNFEELQAELAERSEHCTVVADLCVDLRSRTELLERHIAANAHASNVDIAGAIRELHDSAWDDFAQRLTRFVVLMTGAAEFSVFLLRDNALKAVFQPNDQHTAAGDVTVASDDALFAAIVNERRTLWGSRLPDRELLGNRGTLAAPLLDNSSHVIGMFVIGGATLDDYPDDIDRRVSITATEISRFLDRIILIERWHAAAAPGQSNGHLNPQKSAAEASGADTSASPVATSGGNGPNRAMTLQ
jgi:hypothetical protein